jgi:hypothetical protein
MSNLEWTPDRVKQELPEVRVKMPNGELCMMRVSGRLLQFAEVSDDRGRSIPFAWPTIAHHLNTGSGPRFGPLPEYGEAVDRLGSAAVPFSHVGSRG